MSAPSLSSPVPVFEDWHKRRVYCPAMERCIDDAEREGWRIPGFRRSERHLPLVDGEPVGPLLRKADAMDLARRVAAGHSEPRCPVVADGQDLDAGKMRYRLVRDLGAGTMEEIAMAEHPHDLLAIAARHGWAGLAFHDAEPFSGISELTNDGFEP